MRQSLMLLLATAMVLGQERPPVQAPRTAAECIRTLVARDADWKIMDACEKRLAELPAPEVLPLLAKEPLSRFPTGGIWNGGLSAEDDRKAPFEWRVYYAIGRISRHHMRHAPIDELREALVAASNGRVDDDLACVELYANHRTYGKPGERGDARDRVFGEAADRVMNDSRRAEADRIKAATVLFTMGKNRQIIDFSLELPSIAPMLDTLSRGEAFGRLEPRLVPKAFACLDAELAAHPDYVHGAYFTARQLERLVGVPFAPEKNDPKYPPGQPEFFSQTAANAVAWWKAHRDEYTPEAIEARAAAESRAKAEAEERERVAAAERERNKRVPIEIGQRRRVTIGAVISFPTLDEAAQYSTQATSKWGDKGREYAEKHGASHADGALLAILELNGSYARVRFVGDSADGWGWARELMENAAAER